MTCPHCGEHQFECEELPRDLETRRIVACPKCHKPAVIWWHVEQRCETVEDGLYEPIGHDEANSIAEAVRQSF